MIPKNFPPADDDRDAQRRRALAKVYRLLIRLAEQTEKETILPDIPSQKQDELHS